MKEWFYGFLKRLTFIILFWPAAIIDLAAPLPCFLFTGDTGSIDLLEKLSRWGIE
jgi:hypothetical protein